MLGSRIKGSENRLLKPNDFKKKVHAIDDILQGFKYFFFHVVLSCK